MTIKRLLVAPLALALMSFGSIASAQVAPTLAIQLASTGLTSPIVANQNATMARLLLDTTASTEPVRITRLPFNLTLGSGASTSALTNCRVYNEANPTVPLSTNTTASTTLSSGLNTVILDAPLTLPAGALTTLDLRCDISADPVVGGTYTFSMNTADVAATGATTGLPATVVVRGAVVVPPVVIVPPVVVPGVPNTGAGGDASANVAILLGSLSIAALAFTYTRRLALEK